MPGPLDAAAERLRAAVAQGDYASAQTAAGELRRELDRTIGSATRQSAVAALSAAAGLFACARRDALCGRSHLATRLEALACATAYRPARSRRSSWEVSG